MSTKRWKRGVTLLEIVVVIIVLGILIGLLLPAIQLSRGGHYNRGCKNSMKQIGNAILLFEHQKGCLPRSHRKPAISPKMPLAFDTRSRGWSWLFQITPYMERKVLYDMIDQNDPTDNPDQYSDDVRAVAGDSIAIFYCPSFKYESCDYWVQLQSHGARPESTDETDPDRCQISNYKTVSASRMDSLAVAYGGPMPDYGKEHPDGAIHPNTTYPIDAISDGASSTILFAETTEEACSRWIFGNETEMIGIPDTVMPVRHEDGQFSFDFPPGFDPEDPKWYKESQIDPEEVGRPFVAWEYSGSEAEPSYCGKQWNNPNAWIGPSSYHPSSVNHFFADGSIPSISKEIDAAAYYFMITRCNGDMPPPKQ